MVRKGVVAWMAVSAGQEGGHYPFPHHGVIPAKAGIHVGSVPHAGCIGPPRTWIPAFAGMTPWVGESGAMWLRGLLGKESD
jgi:hypothetical protein